MFSIYLLIYISLFIISIELNNYFILFGNVIFFSCIITGFFDRFYETTSYFKIFKIKAFPKKDFINNSFSKLLKKGKKPIFNSELFFKRIKILYAILFVFTIFIFPDIFNTEFVENTNLLIIINNSFKIWFFYFNIYIPLSFIIELYVKPRAYKCKIKDDKESDIYYYWAESTNITFSFKNNSLHNESHPAIFFFHLDPNKDIRKSQYCGLWYLDGINIKMSIEDSYDEELNTLKLHLIKRNISKNIEGF
jgi:hypothetical protein